MALILNEKYSSYKTFFVNRLLKLLPAYWIVLLLTLIVMALGYAVLGNGLVLQQFIQNNAGFSLSTMCFLLISNLLISGQNLAMFLTANTHGLLEFTSNYLATRVSLHEYMFVPQAWTLCIEMTFYLIAPFLVKRNYKIIFGFMGLSIATRLFLYSIGLKHDPFIFRFFPNELLFFLTGILAYKIYTKIRDNEFIKKYAIYFSIFLLGYVLLYQYIPCTDMIKKIFLYSAIAPLMPIVFVQFKNIKWDRAIGDLSYLVYISHFLIIDIFKIFGNVPFIDKNCTLLVLISTLVFSVLLNKIVIEKIENYRQSGINDLKPKESTSNIVLTNEQIIVT